VYIDSYQRVLRERAGQRGRTRIGGPGIGAAAAGAGHSRLPAHRAAGLAPDRARRAGGAVRAGDRRLHAAPRQRLRDGARRCRDRPPRRCRPGRPAEAAGKWLQDYPGVEVVRGTGSGPTTARRPARRFPARSRPGSRAQKTLEQAMEPVEPGLL